MAKSRRDTPIGFSIDPKFVIGYGLDYAERYRNIPEIQVLSE